MKLAAIMIVVALASSVRADDADPKAKAAALAAEGTKQYNVQQYANAAESYRQAYLLDPKPEYLYATAQSERLGGDCAKALRSYQAYLRTDPPDAERTKTKKNIERCEQDLAGTGTVGMSSLPPTPGGDLVLPAPPEAPVVVVKPEAPPPPPPPKGYIAGHLLVGGGVIAIGAGTFLYLTGRSTIRDNTNAPTYDEFVAGRGELDSAKTKQTIGVSAAAAGGALITGGIIHYVMRSKTRARERAARIDVSGARGSAMVRIEGAW